MNTVVTALSAVPNACLLAWGWRRWAYALLAGGVCALALPPVNLIAALPIALPCLVWLLDGVLEARGLTPIQRLRRGFGLGWLFGFGFFLAGLWWIGSAFLVEADRYAWAMPIAVLAMPAGLALFHGMAVAGAALLWTSGSGRIVALAVTLAGSDWLRGHSLTGFPWNAFGYTVSASLDLMQIASVVGVYGLGLLVLLIALAPATLIDGGKRPFRLGVIALLALMLMFGFGAWRLHGAEDPGLSGLDIRLVQPAIPQAEKWKPENRNWIFDSYLDLSTRPLQDSGRVDAERLIVWPESSLPFLLTQTPSAMVAMSALANGRNQLAIGAIRADTAGEVTRYYNSIFLFGRDGGILGAYDKVHLVPFGEYLPLAKVFDRLGLSRLVQGPGAFTPGYRRRALALESGALIWPLVCYEAIFPDQSAADRAGFGWGHGTDLGTHAGTDRPAILLNVTNDAWFGHTAGPYQHLAQARMRAIEQGIPLVRAANTGVSLVTNAKGRIIAWLPLGQKAIADVPVPKALPRTVYAGIGNSTYGALSLIFFLFSIYYRYNRHSRLD